MDERTRNSEIKLLDNANGVRQKQDAVAGTWREMSAGRRSLADFASMSFRGDSLQQSLGTIPQLEARGFDPTPD